MRDAGWIPYVKLDEGGDDVSPHWTCMCDPNLCVFTGTRRLGGMSAFWPLADICFTPRTCPLLMLWTTPPPARGGVGMVSVDATRIEGAPTCKSGRTYSAWPR